MELFLAALYGIVCSIVLAPICGIFIRGENAAYKSGFPQLAVSAALSGSAFILSDMVYGFTVKGALCNAVFLVLLLASTVDYFCRKVPDTCQILLLVLTLISMMLGFPPGAINRIIGFAAISLPLLAVSMFTNGFGGGDIKLFAVCGLLLGIPNIILSFVISIVLAAIFGIIFVRLNGKKMKTEIAFVPFISFGVMTAQLFGGEIIQWYLGLF